MKDISHKFETLREAVAEATVRVAPTVLHATEYGRATEKGNALEVARVAAIMACKKTWETIPFCHPILITATDVRYDLRADGIVVEVSVKAIAATGVEVEAMVAASTAALTLYDMLKPHAGSHAVDIQGIRLITKHGGKSDWIPELGRRVRTAVVVVSNAVAAGLKPDQAGQTVRTWLERYPEVDLFRYEVIGDDAMRLSALAVELIAAGTDLLITVGGTGITPTDVTVEALEPLVERSLPGIMEAARAYGQRRTPHAMISRGVAGMIADTVVITFPGSTRGARETCEALLPALLHLFRYR